MVLMLKGKKDPTKSENRKSVNSSCFCAKVLKIILNEAVEKISEANSIISILPVFITKEIAILEGLEIRMMLLTPMWLLDISKLWLEDLTVQVRMAFLPTPRYAK